MDAKNIDPNELWTEQKNIKIKSKKNWAILRVKPDRKTKQNYYDVIIGKKGKKGEHTHQGYTLLGNQTFSEERDLMITQTKQVDSKLHGSLPTERKISKTSRPKFQVTVQVTIKSTTKESKISKFEIIDLV